MSAGKTVAGLLAVLLAFTMPDGALADGRFPIRVSADHRHFADASGAPFLMTGDAAWSLIAEMKREDAELYLQDRRKRGFNTILVNLLEHQFARRAPANAYGDRPFKGAAFGELNPAYFDHAAWVIGRAEALGLVVLLAPAYLGANGGGQGWYGEIAAAGPDRMHAYGEAVARRFAKYHNIVCVLGGDFDATDRRLVTSLAEGIEAVLPDAIQTVHSDRGTNTARYWPDARWLAIDTVYDYDNVHKAVLARSKAATMPVVLIEALYEGEHGTTVQTIRRNAYGALLAGAAGQVFGNSPIWHFSAEGLFSPDRDWKAALDSPGARSMTTLQHLFRTLPWAQLQPDRQGSPNFYSAALPDGSITITYGEGSRFPSRTKQAEKALWFDPVSGRTTEATAPEAGVYRTPADSNAGGDDDWLLLTGTANRIDLIRKR